MQGYIAPLGQNWLVACSAAKAAGRSSAIGEKDELGSTRLFGSMLGLGAFCRPGTRSSGRFL